MHMHQNARESILLSEAGNLFLNVNSPGRRDRPFRLKEKWLGPNDVWVTGLQKHSVVCLFSATDIRK